MTRRRIIEVPSLPAAPGWSHSVAAGGWIFGGGIIASDLVTGLETHARANPGLPWTDDPLGAESRIILERIDAVLEAAGADIRRDLLRLWQWIVARYPDEGAYASGPIDWPCFPSGTPYARNLMEMVGDPLRSSTGIGVRQLTVPQAMLSVDFIAAGPGPAKEGVTPPADLPQPKIGYSPATRWGDWVFLAGFGATDFKGDWQTSLSMGPESMVAPAARVNPYIWLGSEIESQTDYTLSVLKRLAEAAGTSLDRCVKADVTLTHPSDFPGMDRVWKIFFPSSPPARNVVTGSRLVIKGLRVEIALLLLAGDSKLERVSITLPEEPPCPGHAPHAVHAGDFLFTSSMLPLAAGSGVPQEMRADPAAPYFRDPARLQTQLLAETLGKLCAAAGTRLDQTCKVQAFLNDMTSLPGMLTAWRQAFPESPPALSAVAMGGGDPLFAPGAAVQWDAIVYAPRT